MRGRRRLGVCWMLAAGVWLVGCGQEGMGGVDGGAGDLGLAGDLGGGGGNGQLRLVVLDDENGLPIPARAIITAVAPTPAVSFDNPASTRGIGADGYPIAPGVVGAPEGVLLVVGDGTVPLRPGTYDVMLTHGPEWEAVTERVTVAPGGVAMLEGRLWRSVDTRGWLAADLHVHTGRSYDSFIDLADRVLSEVSVGVELIVTTDHNIASDLQPEVEALGYGQLARAIVGDEFNFAEGHGGVYPMPYDPSAGDGGLAGLGLNYETVRFIRGGPMFDRLHQLLTSPAVTVNHPRLPPDLGYFLNVGWAPPATLPTAGQFDAFELLNGYMGEPAEVAVLLRDWFFLLSSGTRVTALGSSDTHRLYDTKAGFPRTWLRVPTEDPAVFADGELAVAVKAGRAVASNGPFVQLMVDGAQVGDLVRNVSGVATIELVVDAPGWIDVDTVRLYVNGAKVEEYPVSRASRPLFHQRWRRALPGGDAWVVATASGSRPLPPALIGEHQQGRVLPLAVTNPVYVDGDGDGVWRPQIAQPDPGPLGPPLRVPEESTAHEQAFDWYEPPLGTDPSSWGTP